ncbi:MAG: phosphoadenylyl-sulfate reductase [Kiloniellales bacterium]
MNLVTPAAESLEDRVAGLRRLYGALSGEALLRSMIKTTFPGEIVLVSSFGAESAALLHMVARIDPATPIVFLDTLKLFPETLAYRDALAKRLKLSDVRSFTPDPEEVAHHDPNGDLWRRDANLCCLLRKKWPLDGALAGFSAWINGRKRFHGGGRNALPTIEGEKASGRIKINPLALWSRDDVLRYLDSYDLPFHPLVGAGYSSIGCVPCTRPAKQGEAVRAGRWSWLERSECGIHGEGI